MHISIGADPEFFVKQTRLDEKTPDGLTADEVLERAVQRIKKNKFKFVDTDEGEQIVPICGKLGGSKKVPKPIKALGPGFYVQEDGIAAEFNIPSAITPAAFSNNIHSALNYIERQILLPQGLARCYTNNVSLKREWAEQFPDILSIGCDPDYCAYDAKDGIVEPRVGIADQAGMVRGTGGHIHLGYSHSLCPPEILAQLLDLTIALRYINTGEDKQGARRSLWGIAGLYRPKNYGMEYRTLSNFWIWSSSAARDIAGISFALIQSIAKSAIPWQALVNVVNWEAVRNIILREDAAGAGKMITQLRSSHSIYAQVLDIGTDMGLKG